MRYAHRIGSSVIEPFGNPNVHSPNQSSEPTDADGRHAEPTLDLFLDRDRVLGDERTEDRHAALVDELPVRVDHRFHAAARQTIHLAVDDLDRAVDGPVRLPVGEDQLEREEHVVADVDHEVVRVPHVGQEPEPDRFHRARDRHLGTSGLET
jgi:hypothetical protein